jgi:hypothetical protein
MAKYRITFTFVGSGRATIEAASEAEAITKFSNGEWSQAKREFDDHQIQEIYEIEYRGD